LVVSSKTERTTPIIARYQQAPKKKLVCYYGAVCHALLLIARHAQQQRRGSVTSPFASPKADRLLL